MNSSVRQSGEGVSELELLYGKYARRSGVGGGVVNNTKSTDIKCTYITCIFISIEHMFDPETNGTTYISGGKLHILYTNEQYPLSGMGVLGHV